MSFVVDPSAILGTAMEDEKADFTESVLDEIQKNGASAPSIFWYELRNVLVVNERRGRIAKETTTAFLATVEELPIEMPSLPSEVGVIDLARRYELSVYDAAYLDLALRLGAPLATLDTRLRDVAGKAGVSLFSGGAEA